MLEKNDDDRVERSPETTGALTEDSHELNPGRDAIGGATCDREPGCEANGLDSVVIDIKLLLKASDVGEPVAIDCEKVLLEASDIESVEIACEKVPLEASENSECVNNGCENVSSAEERPAELDNQEAIPDDVANVVSIDVSNEGLAERVAENSSFELNGQDKLAGVSFEDDRPVADDSAMVNSEVSEAEEICNEA